MDDMIVAAAQAVPFLKDHWPVVFLLFLVNTYLVAPSLPAPGGGTTLPGKAYGFAYAVLTRAAGNYAKAVNAAVKAAVFVLVSAGVLGLAACAPGTGAGLATGLVTMAQVAAANHTSVANLVNKGALFCADHAPAMNEASTVAGVVAVAISGAGPGGIAAASVIGQTSEGVATGCSLLGKVPVPAPGQPGGATGSPSSVPVVTVPTALPAVAA